MNRLAAACRIRNVIVCGVAFAAMGGFLPAQQSQSSIPNMAGFRNFAGTVRTFSQSGDFDLNNAFFQSLGTNGRSCATCHQPDDGMSISAAHVQVRLDESDGLDPIFLTNDGSN